MTTKKDIDLLIEECLNQIASEEKSSNPQALTSICKLYPQARATCKIAKDLLEDISNEPYDIELQQKLYDRLFQGITIIKNAVTLPSIENAGAIFKYVDENLPSTPKEAHTIKMELFKTFAIKVAAFVLAIGSIVAGIMLAPITYGLSSFIAIIGISIANKIIENEKPKLEMLKEQQHILNESRCSPFNDSSYTKNNSNYIKTQLFLNNLSPIAKTTKIIGNRALEVRSAIQKNELHDIMSQQAYKIPG